MQFGLDLGGVDVHAAGNHHVLGPVAQIKESILVEIAHIARRDQACFFAVAALLIVLVIGEIGDRARAGKNFADLARGQCVAARIHHAHIGFGQWFANRAGVGQPLLSITEHHDAHFG